ncbi:MAG: glycosyltransferase family 39 protein [Flavobacteriaceae bacterium]|nr:glycosyltransferase family 39 protein [Flavobacteriaceae bacterium]
MSHWVYVLFILILGFVLRIIYLDFQSPWLDEIITLKITSPESSYSDIIDRMKSGNQHLPLYYSFVHFIGNIFGHGIYMVRLVSVLFGVLGIWLMYLLSKEFLPKNYALIPTMFCAVNFFLIQYAQEARSYTLLFVASILTLLYFVKFIKNPTVNYALFYGLSLGLILNIHVYALFVVWAQVLVLIYLLFHFKKPKLLTFSILSFGIAIIFALPMLYVLWNNAANDDLWIPEPGLLVFYNIPLTFFGESRLLFGWVILFLLFGFYALFTGTQNQKSELSHRISAIILFSAMIIPFITTFLISKFYIPIIESRYLIIILPPLFIILAFGFYQLKSIRLQIISVLAFSVLSVIILMGHRQFYTQIYKTQFREVAQYIQLESPKTTIVSDLSWYMEYFFENENYIFEHLDLETYSNQMKNTELPKEFWYFGAHNQTYNPQAEYLQTINNQYYITDEFDGYDIWAKKFEHKSVIELPDLSNFDLTQNQQGNNIKSWVEYHTFTENQLNIKAWAFLENQNSQNSQTYIVLAKANEIQSIIPVQSIIRPDINQAFPGNFDLSNAGIEQIISLADAEPGVYHVLFYLQNGKAKGFVKSDIQLEVF